MKTQYRIDHYKDEYNREQYYLVYLLEERFFFGLLKKSRWVVIPKATNKRALGLETTILDDCINGSVFSEITNFAKRFPYIEDYFINEYKPELTRLINKWVNLKARDEDIYNDELEAIGIII